MSVHVVFFTHGWHFRLICSKKKFCTFSPSYCVYLDRVGRHVAHELSAVGVIQHGHQSEGVPQQAVQLVDVLSR